MTTITNLTPVQLWDRNSRASRATKRATRKYGIDACVEAYTLCEIRGEGARTIAQSYMYGHFKGSTNAADAAINAGRELAGGMFSTHFA